MSCYLCASTDIEPQIGSVRDNPELQVLKCRNCGLIFLSQNSHCSNQFYEESGMHSSTNEGLPDVRRMISEAAGDDARRFKYLEERLMVS